jgi:hypothetical protein
MEADLSRTRSPETGPQNNAFSDATKEVSRESYCYRSEPEQIPNLCSRCRWNDRRRAGMGDTQPAVVPGQMRTKPRDCGVFLRSLCRSRYIAKRHGHEPPEHAASRHSAPLGKPSCDANDARQPRCAAGLRTQLIALAKGAAREERHEHECICLVWGTRGKGTACRATSRPLRLRLCAELDVREAGAFQVIHQPITSPWAISGSLMMSTGTFRTSREDASIRQAAYPVRDLYRALLGRRKPG